VDASADPDPNFNNESLSTLGHDLLTYYTSEYLICTYPRLPLSLIFASMYAYVGPKTLTAMTREWGVEHAASPGGEVDPGLLQFRRLPPGTELQAKENAPRPYQNMSHWRKTVTSKIFYDNEFGDTAKTAVEGVSADQASATFVRAVMGAIYLHAGRPAAKRFFQQHFLSRHLNMAELFNFEQPTRDLTRLCARENFERPVAKVIAETGRKSRHPVFVVGIFSGNDKLGEGQGASLGEARERAAVAALKGWYLYSPLNVRLPSAMEDDEAEPWKPVHVDLGEVIV
jgi:dsRNA-specific ribonuclease